MWGSAAPNQQAETEVQGSVIFEEDSWSPKKSCMTNLLLDHFYEKRTNNYSVCQLPQYDFLFVRAVPC